jgi:hypothetical protein
MCGFTVWNDNDNHRWARIPLKELRDEALDEKMDLSNGRWIHYALFHALNVLNSFKHVCKILNSAYEYDE